MQRELEILVLCNKKDGVGIFAKEIKSFFFSILIQIGEANQYLFVHKITKTLLSIRL